MSQGFFLIPTTIEGWAFQLMGIEGRDHVIHETRRKHHTTNESIAKPHVNSVIFCNGIYYLNASQRFPGVTFCFVA